MEANARRCGGGVRSLHASTESGALINAEGSAERPWATANSVRTRQFSVRCVLSPGGRNTRVTASGIRLTKRQGRFSLLYDYTELKHHLHTAVLLILVWVFKQELRKTNQLWRDPLWETLGVGGVVRTRLQAVRNVREDGKAGGHTRTPTCKVIGQLYIICIYHNIQLLYWSISTI